MSNPAENLSLSSAQGKSRWKPLASQSFAAALVAALVAGWCSSRLEPEARAEPRKVTSTEADEHFRSGGRLSEAVLQEILVVLKNIDTRLERLEKVASQPSVRTAAPGAVKAPASPIRFDAPAAAEDERIPAVRLDQIKVRRGS